MKIWNRLSGEPWAITQPALDTILSIAARQNEKNDIKETIEAVSARQGRELDNSCKTIIRDDVAIINVVGPLFRYANLFTQISGASSYELLAKDFTYALENADVKAIIIDIDSPGGEVNGCAEFASMIFDARGKKPIVAYASGDSASGAYWIASACDKICVSQTSALGSIGVVAMYKGCKDEKTIEIVSSQSPFKRLDPKTDDGKAKLQARIDAMADVFVNSVAKYRGVDPSDVLNDFGGGDLFIGEHAVTNKLADKVSSFEKTLQSLSKQNDPATKQGFSFSKHKELSMGKNQGNKIDSQESELDLASLEDLEKNHPQLVSQISEKAHSKGFDEGVKKGVEKERDRIGAIISCDEAGKREQLARHLAFATDMSPEVAKSTLSAAPVMAEQTQQVSDTGFEKVMASISNPSIETSQVEDEGESIDQIAKRIAGGGC